MKIFFVIFFMIVASLSMAQERPKIALVLSGGGARGGAHVGVLKILEANHIPIDMIVGTSMGSFIGGLYASGKSPQEIEKMLLDTNWEKYINTDFNRQDIPIRKKQIDYTYQGRLGLGINVENKIVLPTGVLKRELLLLKFMELTQDVQDIKDFDAFPIPFRAIATDIKNGDTVVLKSGSLAKAIYASSSIPGGFQPINIDGKDLVDGGVSDNLPIDIAKKMGADIIIAVDVSEHFSKKIDVNSYIVVMGQLVNILMRKNADESLATLTKKDILITPNLKGFSGLDADKYREIIERGYKSAKKLQPVLQKIALSDFKYKEYKKKYRKKIRYYPPIIDAIEIQNTTYLADESILKRIHQHIGEALNVKQLQKDLLHLYNRMLFDSVDYTIKKQKNQTILVIHTTPSWNNHGDIRFAIGFEDDFKGHSSYSIKFGYTMFGLNDLGAEWKNDFEIGRSQKAYTEFFQPLDTMQRYYIRPSIFYKSLTDIFPFNGMSNQEFYSSRYGGRLAFGAHIGMSLELEIALGKFKDDLHVDSLMLQKNYNALPLNASLQLDNLDNVNFPKKGLRSHILWTKEMHTLGSSYNYEQIYADIEKPFKFYANNITLYMKYGNTYKKNDSDIIRLAGKFTLGGLFNLSGYVPYSFVGDNVVLGVLKYTYELKGGGFFGSLNAPLYIGFALEGGQTWDNGEHIGIKSLHKSVTAYVAADTFLGPLYLAFGSSESGKESAYLYLGEKF